MAYFKITEPNKNPKWIKTIDRANGTLEFSEDRNGCFQQDSGFFADSEFAYLKFHFTEAYPELEHMTIDTDWHTNTQGGGLPWGGVGVEMAAPVAMDEEAAPINQVAEPVALQGAAVEAGPQAPIELQNQEQFIHAYNHAAVADATEPNDLPWG
jgi:hypothetical protein